MIVTIDWGTRHITQHRVKDGGLHLRWRKQAGGSAPTGGFLSLTVRTGRLHQSCQVCISAG